MTLIARAPGKVNLCLFLGPVRADGRHELVTLFESVSLADLIEVTPVPAATGDQIVCPGIEGPNIVKQALAVERRVAFDEFERAVEASAAEVYGWSA